MNQIVRLASSPSRIRQNNAAAALQALFHAGRLSRADLAREMRLNRSSSGSIIAELSALGLVREIEDDKRKDKAFARVGRPGILLELIPDAVSFLGAEIGVEHISTVQIDLAANIVRSNVEAFDGRAVGVDEAIARAVEQAFCDLTVEARERSEGFGLSSPSQMSDEGVVQIAPLLGWRNVNLVERLRAILPPGMPVMAENDANAFAIGASYRMKGAPSGVTLFLVIESGVGGGIVIDGKLFRGGHGLAGEIGHFKTPGGEGRTLEQAIGLEWVLGEYRALTGRPENRFDDFLLEVRDRAPGPVAIADEWARALAFALVQACRLIDPNRIVLGGSVAQLYPMVAARVASYIKAGQEGTFPLPEIALNAEASAGSAFGAASMLHQLFLSPGERMLRGKVAIE
ncbi:ROK family protein [Roseiarcus sp.]|uniref:ROK family protein n=1 Tax=Roseiarcus sp. TaxID=1969460 RepID=UPI003F960B3F